jgi:hypothetical protein
MGGMIDAYLLSENWRRRNRLANLGIDGRMWGYRLVSYGSGHGAVLAAVNVLMNLWVFIRGGIVFE